ncbi:MAG: hypothetical protein R3E79_46520 [Caldilineaceae bacterium]
MQRCKQHHDHVLLLIGLLALAGSVFFFSERVSSAAAADTATLTVYDDALAGNWQNWSWNTTVNFANSSPVHSGAAAIAVQYDQAWAGLSLRAPAPIDATQYSTITFWVHGGATGARQLTFFTQATDGGGNSTTVSIDAPAGAWQPVTIALSALGNPTAIARLNLQDRSGSVQPLFYVDDIQLISGAPAPTATPPPPATTRSAFRPMAPQ